MKGFPHGPVLVTVFINGIWSQAAYLVVEKYDPQKQVKNLKAKTMKTLYPLIPDLQTTRARPRLSSKCLPVVSVPVGSGPDRTARP